MRSRRNLSWRLLVAAAIGLGVQAASAVDVRDARGMQRHFEQPPQRIVSLLPSITESVCALGACGRLVGTDRFSNAPPQVQSLPKLGGLEDAQVERIVALRPDLVLVAKSARATERLEALGLAVLVVDSSTQAEVRHSMELIAQVLGTPQAAVQVEAGIEHELATAAARVPAALRGRRVYFEIGTGPYAAGESSFIGETLARLGMANLVPAAMGPWPKLNPEFVVRGQPDIVMAAQRDVPGMSTRPGWDQLRALRAGHVCGFDPETYEMLIRPGPRLGQAALAIADCLARLPS